MLRRWREDNPLWPLRLGLLAVGAAVVWQLEAWDGNYFFVFFFGLLVAGFAITFFERRLF